MNTTTITFDVKDSIAWELKIVLGTFIYSITVEYSTGEGREEKSRAEKRSMKVKHKYSYKHNSNITVHANPRGTI